MMSVTKNEEETYKLAKDIAAKVKNGGFVCLFGDLGTGKTTFTKGIAKALGIDHFSIKSPTYTYIREYKEKKLYHIDLYRIEEIDELLLLEIQENTTRKSICGIAYLQEIGDMRKKRDKNLLFTYLLWRY